MNCETCQEMMSAYLDLELDEASSEDIRTHLSVCLDCVGVCKDLADLIESAELESGDCAMPPNPQALWLRINNIIEGEVDAEIAKEQKAKAAKLAASATRRRWHLSFPQLASALFGIALVSSLLTFIGLRHYTQPGDEFTQTSEPTVVDRVLGKLGLVETPQQLRKRKMQEREAAIAYWDKRVQLRRGQWDAHLRDAFDRNLNEINQAVSEYSLILEENPQDDLSGEMLDTALNEKMELLREFSEL